MTKPRRCLRSAQAPSSRKPHHPALSPSRAGDSLPDRNTTICLGTAAPLGARPRARAESEPGHDPARPLRELSRENLLVKARGKEHVRRGRTAADAPADQATTAFWRTSTNASSNSRSRRWKWLGRQSTTTCARSCISSCRPRRRSLRSSAVGTSSGEPFSFTVNYLPTDIGARVDPGALKTSPLNAVLERALKIPIVRADETVEAAAANPEVAQQLGIRVLSPVMHVTRVIVHRPRPGFGGSRDVL